MHTRWPKPRLSSLLWLVAVAAAFLGGVRYERDRGVRDRVADLRDKVEIHKRGLQKLDRIARSTADPARMSVARKLAEAEAELKKLTAWW